MKRKTHLFLAAALTVLPLAMQAQNPSTTVVLDNGARLTFSTWTYQGVTNANLDDADSVDGKAIVIPS